MNSNITNMQKLLTITLAASMTLFIVACGSSTKDEKAEIGDLKVKLEKLKKEKAGLDAQILQVEQQLTKLDPAAMKQAKLIAADTVRIGDFAHFIELQGKIDAENISYVTPKGMGGQIRAIYVKLGDRVRKGQSILKLDDVLLRQNLVGAQQQLAAAKSQLAQAKSFYERQQNLWKENIGTEVQVLTYKTQMESAQSQVNALQSGVTAAQEQLNQTTVVAEMDGVIDQMNYRVGELFVAATAADPRFGIRIVNNRSVKVVTNVPENYISRVKKGDSVLVEIPEIGKAGFRSVISVIGSTIDATNRSFIVEAKLPSDPLLKPNQLATMKILDYKAKSSLAVPVNVVQSDEKGKFVYIMEKAGDKWVARKRVVIAGESYGGATEIKSGLNEGDVIITEGYQTVYDGQSVTVK